jgi:hypothetical protein
MNRSLNFMLLYFTALVCCAQAQRSSEGVYGRSYYLDVGLGASVPLGMLSSNIHFTGELGNQKVVTAGITAGTELAFFQSKWKAFDSYSVTFGKIVKRKAAIFKYTVGPAYTIVRNYSDSDVLYPASQTNVDMKRTVGIQAELQVLGAWKVIGGGVTLFGNINPEFPYAGITLSAAIGKVLFGKKS